MFTENYLVPTITGLLANGLTSLIEQFSKKDYGVKQMRTEKFESTLQKATAIVAKNLSIDDPVIQDKLKIFLVSNEVDTIVRKIFLFCFLEADSNEMIKLENEFSALFRLDFKKDNKNISISSKNLFCDLKKACNWALNISILPLT